MMARRHGWELPAQKCSECPRCTAIDPADPGILIEPGRVSPNRSHNGSEVPGNASSVSKSVFRNEGIYNNSNSGGCCSKVGGCIVKEDCRNDQDMQQGGEEEALFCTLCNAELSASVGAGLHYDRNDKLICTLRGKKAYPVASNRFVNVLLKGRCDIDKELNQPTPHGALELVWNILDFQKDQDVRLKVGYEIFDKIPYVQIRENNWAFNADINGRWNVRYHL